MDENVWQRTEACCDEVVGVVSAFLAALTPHAGLEAAADPRPALRAAATLSLELARQPDLAPARRSIGEFAHSVADWHTAHLSGSGVEHRYRRALQQQTVSLLTACLRVRAQCLNELERQAQQALDEGATPGAGRALPRPRPQGGPDGRAHRAAPAATPVR